MDELEGQLGAAFSIRSLAASSSIDLGFYRVVSEGFLWLRGGQIAKMMISSAMRHTAISAWAIPKIGSSLATTQLAIMPATASNILMIQPIMSPFGITLSTLRGPSGFFFCHSTLPGQGSRHERVRPVGRRRYEPRQGPQRHSLETHEGPSTYGLQNG